MSNSKIALVTGASRGLGKDMALSIAQKGLDVILTYKSNTERAEQVVQEIIDIGQQAVAMQLDITNFNHFGTFMENVHELTENKFGRTGIDYLINNAGIGINAPFQETTEEQLDSMINVHTSCLENLKRRRWNHQYFHRFDTFFRSGLFSVRFNERGDRNIDQISSQRIGSKKHP